MPFRRALAAIATLLLWVLCADVRDAGANTWPPAKGADMTDPANWPNDPDYPGLWEYFSWLPKQNSSAAGPYVGADVALGAAGMSVDVGWTYTIGRPDVLIAVIDNGIEWDDTQVVDKAYLNPLELAKHKPQDASGNACAGAGALAGYDCNGDGVFNVADYLSDPRIAPTVTDATDFCHEGENPTAIGPVRQLGDLNHNCLIDAGDLIELFSDGVDDDANGYTDDISGWDFLKNDNDPYDDVRYDHGTGEANWSVSQGNDGQGSIGACPDCPFVMLRVEEGFIADTADVAKAMVYATDNGAKVIQAAMGGIDMPSFTQAAEDYAYAHGVLIVASMADEDSRHHNFPVTSNHVLQVHAIAGDGDTGLSGSSVTTSSTSFLNFVVCTNYGGQNMLSISGHACSSEATGRGAGVAALLVSEGLNDKLTLSPEEVMQLLKSTADLVNVPESRSTDPGVSSKFVESLPYFSQRFGYGRPNVAHAMEQIDAGLIPPEVDLTSPAWFDVFYADRATAPVPIVGRVAAKRALSYDYIVEWAPGVEPDDSAFQPLVDWVRNVPASTVTGGSSMAPLGMLAPAEIDTTHTPDPDSKMHENDRTITLRVRAIAYYAGGSVAGEARRSIAIVNQGNGLDPDLVTGFPFKVGASMDSSSPKLADIDGDGLRDIVVAASDGSVHVFSLKSGLPVEVAGFPVFSSAMDGLNASVVDPSVPSYLGAPAYANGSKGGGIDPTIARETLVGTVAVGDLDGDKKSEIVFSSWMGTVYVVDASGTPLPGWPKRLPLVPSCPLDPARTRPAVCMDPDHQWARGAGAAPVLANMDGDKAGTLEIVQAAFDGNIYIWHDDGTPLAGWPVQVHGPTANAYNRILSTPAVADFNGDGILDVATGSNETVGAGDGAGLAFVIDGRGTATPGGSPYLSHWPVVLTSLDLLPLVGEGISGSPAIADFVGSGRPQVLFQGNGAPPYVFPADPGVQKGFNDPPNRLPDFPGDAGTCTTSNDCTSASQPSCVAGQCVQVGFDPTSIFGEGSTATRPDTMFPLFSSPAIGDLDQDGVPDPIMSGGSLSLASIIASASASTRPFQFLLAGWSGATGHMFYGMPVPIEDYTFLVNETVADITGDGYPEVMVGTGGYFLHAADACGCEAPSWPKFTDGWITATAAVGDLDGDHKLEVVVGTREGNLFAWHTQGTDTGTIEWESFHHDNGNTGDYSRALDQGVLRGASVPIDCATDCTAKPATTPTKYAAGGCALTSMDRGTGGAAIAVTTALAALLVRRRRRR